MRSSIVGLLPLTALVGGTGVNLASRGERGLAHQWIAQPLLPDHFAGFFIYHDQGATLGVEGDIAGFNYSGGGAVIGGFHFPNQGAGFGGDRIKLMRPTSTAP